MRVLLLSGTEEGRHLAATLAETPGVDVITSLAGRTSAPAPQHATTRIGGFGGAPGLTGWLVTERVDAVVDATHPFAAAITASAVAAARAADVPLLLLRRPPWRERPGDDWRRVPSVREAARALPGDRVFLTIGRKDLAAFAHDTRHWFLVRSVDPAQAPLPPRVHPIQARGPFTVENELDLMKRHAVDTLVTKDSGGSMTGSKLTAARRLRLPVVMIDRPPAPAGVPTVYDTARALAWLAGLPR